MKRSSVVCIWAVALACSPAQPGKAGHACYANGTCDEGLSCQEGTCVVKGAAQAPVSEEPEEEDPQEGLEDFVEAWARAQNTGDFAAYSGAYSGDFRGVRRSRGSQDKTFEREGWLQDRRRMFNKAQKVQVEGLKVAPAEASGVFRATFEQRWQSPTYADRGDKVLELKREAGQWKILREEMLSSEPWAGDGSFKKEADLAPTTSRNVVVVYSFYDQAQGEQARRRAQADVATLRAEGFPLATVLAEQEWDNFTRCCHLVVITGIYSTGAEAAEDVAALKTKGLRKGYVKRVGNFIDQGVDCGH